MDLPDEDIVIRMKKKLDDLKQNEVDIPAQFSVVLKAFQAIAYKFVGSPKPFIPILLKYFRYLLSLKSKLRTGNAHSLYEEQFGILTKTLGSIVAVPWLHNRYQAISDLIFYWLTSTKHVPANVKLTALKNQTDAFKHLVALAAASGDNETQKQIFELILFCYASGKFDSPTRELIGEYFRMVNFEIIERILYRDEDSKQAKRVLRRILNQFNEVVENKVLSFIVKDIRIGRQHTLQPYTECGFWIDFSTGSNSISFAFDGKSIINSLRRNRLVRALITQGMILEAQTSICSDTKDITLSFTLSKSLSLSDNETQAIIANERIVTIVLLYTEEKYPMLEQVLRNWYNVDIVVTESNHSYDGDEDDDGFAMPNAVALENRTFGIPRLSHVDESSYASDEWNERGQQTQDLPVTNKTALCNSYHFSTNNNVSERSGSSCVIVSESENSRANSVIVKNGSVDKPPDKDVIENDGTSEYEDGKVFINESKSVDEQLRIYYDADEKFSSEAIADSQQPQQTDIYNDNGVLNSYPRDRNNRSPFVDGKTTKTGKHSTQSPQLNLSLTVAGEMKTQETFNRIGTTNLNLFTNSANGNYSRKGPLKEATNHKQNADAAEISPMKNVPRKSEEFVVHPTQVIAYSISEDEMEPPEQPHRSPKLVESQNCETPRSHCWNSTNNNMKTIERNRNEITYHFQSDSTIENANPIVHSTQTIRRAKPISSSLESNKVTQIEVVDSDEENTIAELRKKWQPISRNKAAGAAGSTSSKCSTRISVRADVHSPPAEIDEILKKCEAMKGERSTGYSLPAQMSQYNLDAIESYHSPEKRPAFVKRRTPIVAKPKRTRKKLTQSIDEIEPFVATPIKVTKSTLPRNSQNRGDSIYTVSTQQFESDSPPANDSPPASVSSQFQRPVRAIVNGIILDQVNDEREQPEIVLPIEKPAKTRRKAFTDSSRAKAIPKTQRKSKKTPDHHVSFLFQTPKTKRSQSRKKVKENPLPISPCSTIRSMPAVRSASGRKRKLYNKDAEFDELGRYVDDDDDVQFVEAKRLNVQSKNTDYDEILETTVSSAADIVESREKNPKKYLNRVNENMKKISSQNKKSPPTRTAMDPFDIVKESYNVNDVRSSGKVTYSYRTSTKTKSAINTNRSSSKKTSTRKSSVDVVKTVSIKKIGESNMICSARSDISDFNDDVEMALLDDHNNSTQNRQLQVFMERQTYLEDRLAKITRMYNDEVPAIRDELIQIRKQLQQIMHN